MTIAQNYQSNQTRRTWYVEKIAPLLMMSGFLLHLIRLAQIFQFGAADLSVIVLPAVDLVLALLMTYCSIIMMVFRRQFFGVFDMSATWRKTVYWIVTVYFTVSIPGHLHYLMTHDTAYFNFFPWWFSLFIMTVYVGIIAYFFTLKPARTGA
jgi:hypothetical protein